MPFENVHGNGGLLTTVGDLLRWNENFVTPKVGDAAFVAEEQTPGRFTDGRAHELRLRVCSSGAYRGVREVSHSGSTAGYRAFLTRYPDPASLGRRAVQRGGRQSDAIRARRGGRTTSGAAAAEPAARAVRSAAAPPAPFQPSTPPI